MILIIVIVIVERSALSNDALEVLLCWCKGGPQRLDHQGFQVRVTFRKFRKAPTVAECARIGDLHRPGSPFRAHMDT